MKMADTPIFVIKDRVGARVTFQSSEGHSAHVFVLENDLVRILVAPGGKVRFPNTWAVAPGIEDVPVEGRDRFSLEGFSCPEFSFENNPNRVAITTSQVRLTIQLAGFFCAWEVCLDGQWRFAARDRKTQSYNFGWWDDRVYHYLEREADEMYFGLGERAGNTNRAGSSFRMTNLDAMGYNARTTDPLYKHFPFYLTWKRRTQAPFGLFYDTVSDCTFDLGRELDNYHGYYRYFVADHGDLDLYFIGGASLADIVRRFTWLTGRPAFPPKWSLGYSGSTMTYTDAPDAQERMAEFLDRCAEHDILCDSFHLSSGYTSIGAKRYVFNWNKEKFPDPAGFARSFRAHGVRLCPNIKPCLLTDHPLFAEAAAKGLFIRDKKGGPLLVQFWDELGAYLDFTNAETIRWWKKNVIEALLKPGLSATWNDNNEFEIWSPGARIQGFGAPRAAVEAKALQPLLMMRSSREAQKHFAPEERPFLVSRSGTVGMQRYAQTWSGDNFTSWETLRYNIKMGIGLALSGVSNLGHDVGGFVGPAPEPELFVRWVQFGIFLPRFSIHSWNEDQSVTEPWSYPAVTPYIRELIKLRYRLLPYLYHLLWDAHTNYEPMIRPTFLDYPDDERCFAENDEMLLGRDLLVAPVVEPGDRARSVYLPRGAGWYDFWQGDYYAGGQEVTLPAPWDRPPLLVREGCALPLNIAEQHFNQRAEQRGFFVFPMREAGRFVTECFEDDGESERYRQGVQWFWRLEVVCSVAELAISVTRTGQPPPGGGKLAMYLPRQDRRKVHIVGGALLDDKDSLAGRELLIEVA
jgi:alpha-glucosidase